MTDDQKTWPCHTCGANRVTKPETSCDQCFADILGWKENW